jgi:hypothetical protein
MGLGGLLAASDRRYRLAVKRAASEPVSDGTAAAHG